MSGFAICQKHGKEMFASEEAALERLEEVQSFDLAGTIKVPKRAYYEPNCGFWHLTSMNIKKICHLCEIVLTLEKIDQVWEYVGDHLVVFCSKHGEHHAGSYQSKSCTGVEKMCHSCWHPAKNHRLPSEAGYEVPIPVLICSQCPSEECRLNKNHRR